MRPQALIISSITMLVMLVAGLAPSTAEAVVPSPGTSGSTTTAVVPSTQRERVHFRSRPGECLRVVTAGIRTRSAQSGPAIAGGTIALPTGPSAGGIVWAGLYWVILSDAPSAGNVTLNGSALAPVALPVTDSPCWSEAHAYAYFADATAAVQPGPNRVDGLADSGIPAVAPQSEGATLVVVYSAPQEGACEIVVMDGNDLLNASGQRVDNPIALECSDLPANLTFIGADGQTGPGGLAPDDQMWNDVPLGSGDDWNASDPPAPGAESNIGWDTDSWSVTAAAPTTASVRLPSLGGPADCLDWIATVLEVGVRDCSATTTVPSTWGAIKAIYR